jgi:hypothetical protein
MPVLILESFGRTVEDQEVVNLDHSFSVVRIVEAGRFARRSFCRRSLGEPLDFGSSRLISHPRLIQIMEAGS